MTTEPIQSNNYCELSCLQITTGVSVTLFNFYFQLQSKISKIRYERLKLKLIIHQKHTLHNRGMAKFYTCVCVCVCDLHQEKITAEL